jgi:hypothetical protein
LTSDSRPVLTGPSAGDHVLGLARSGTEPARAQLRAYTAEQLAGAVTRLLPRERAELLELVERPDEIVPLLPEAVFASTVLAMGIEDAGWLVQHASAEQRVAAVDLDCWKDFRFSPSRLFEWIDAMIEAGPETLVAAFDELDPELWVLAMKEMADFSVGVAESPDMLTGDGLVSYSPRSADHEERLQAILGTALTCSPPHYWSFVYGAMFESRQECEHHAVRWQRGRLNDLGFPDRTEAMRAYRPLRAEAVTVRPVEVADRETSALATSSGPPALLDGTLLGLALGQLPPDRASEVFEYVLAVATSLAVADELPLADPDSVSSSFRKALRGIERGLAELAKLREQPPVEVLSGVDPLDLFRLGATLDDGLRPHQKPADLWRAADGDDWNVRTEVIEPEDRTLAEDGRLRK